MGFWRILGTPAVHRRNSAMATAYQPTPGVGNSKLNGPANTGFASLHRIVMNDPLELKIDPIRNYRVNGHMLPYTDFVPRLFNWALSLGFQPGKILPSRAFCSDESQGFPVMMIAKHFGTFPFNHGQVGGVVATSRHASYAAHGHDLVIIQASHVGFDPDSRGFGTYKRLQTMPESCSASCGKLDSILAWYQDEYTFARNNLLLHTLDGREVISVDSNLTDESRNEGLILRAERLFEFQAGSYKYPLQILSTSKTFAAARAFVDSVGSRAFGEIRPTPIGDRLTASLFNYRRDIPLEIEGKHHIENILLRFMSRIVTSQFPILSGALLTTQMEFDRVYRSIVKEGAYGGRNLIFISGLNIDFWPHDDQLFPMTTFVPWAAYIQTGTGTSRILEQRQLQDVLCSQATDNPHQIDLDEAIESMG